MKKFTIDDFLLQRTDDNHEYWHCIMGNGIELQIDGLEWGYEIGAYDKHGQLICSKLRQPFLITFAGETDFLNSTGAILAKADKLYEMVLKRNSTIDNVLPVW